MNSCLLLYAEVHEGELLKELPGQLRTAITSHVLRDVFDTSHLFAVCVLLEQALRQLVLLPCSST